MNLRTVLALAALAAMSMATLAAPAEDAVKKKPASEKPVAASKDSTADKSRAKMGVPDDSIRPQKQK